MPESKDGGAGSSSKPEPNTPNGISSHDEKKVSTMNNPDAVRKKRYLLECNEGSDGALSHCNLIPLTEVDEPEPLPEDQTGQGVPPSEGKPEAAINQCTSEKCPIPLSKYTRAMKKRLDAEGKTGKKV